MSKLGALLFALFFGLFVRAVIPFDAAFWVSFCFSAFIGVPIGAIMDASRGRREAREEREDAIAQRQIDAISRAIEKGRPNVNVDARSVHMHKH